ncbi:uncharacterized protein [Dysidea avara]|uniref:uncharacterized protein isoform X2 n=1 Tax=Dysidea avara TaxID=196820 RepID=UPI00332521B4
MSLSKISRNGTNKDSDEDGDLEFHERRKRGQRRRRRFMAKRTKTEDFLSSTFIESDSTHASQELSWIIKASEQDNVAVLRDAFTNKGYDVNSICDTRPGFSNRTLLQISAYNGKVKAVKELLNQSADINAVDQNNCTALHYASYAGNIDAVKILMKRGASVSAADVVGRTPFHLAAWNGNNAVVELLLNNGFPIDTTDKHGSTALHWASDGGHCQTIEHLLQRGANINAVHNGGRTPLHWAAGKARIKAIEVLVSNGASINIPDKYGETALHDAARRGEVKTVETYLRLGATSTALNKENETALLVAVNWKQSNVVRCLVEDFNVATGVYDQETQQRIRELLVVAKNDKTVAEQANLTRKAISNGYLESVLLSSNVRVAMLGSEGSGKTCLADTLTKREFYNTPPTTGASQMEIVVKSTVDWSPMTSEETIDNLQQQMLQEAMHWTEQTTSSHEPTTKSSVPMPSSTTTTTNTTMPTVTGSTSNPSTLANQPVCPDQPVYPDPPMLKLPGEEETYLLTMDEYRKLPSVFKGYDPTTKYISIWDYAGQSVFSHTHGLFLSEEVVCIIVFDASKPLDEVPKRRYKDDKSTPRSTLQTICYWMDLISCRISKPSTSDRDQSELLPTFILVGTHIDLLSEDIKEAQEIAFNTHLPLLENELLHKPFAKHIAGSKNGRLFTRGPPSVYFLSNKIRDPNVNKALQQTILDASPMKIRPTKYIKMERNLMLSAHKEKQSVLNMANVKEIARNCGLSSSEEVLEALEFFHQKGSLLYFNQVPALSDVIILCPQWLARLLTYVLTNLICRPAGSPLGSFAKERNNEGLLRQELLEWCVDRFKTDEAEHGSTKCDIIWKTVVDLLLKFNLMVDVTSSSLAAKKNIAADKRLFLVPHLLPQEKFIPTTDPCYKVLYYFPGEFIPDNLVDQLIVKCIKWNGKHRFDFIRLSYQWVCLNLQNLLTYELRVIPTNYVIELTMIPKLRLSTSERIQSFEHMKTLIEVVKDFIDELMKEQMAAIVETLSVQCFFPCPKCSELHIEVEMVAENSEVFCVTKKVNVNMTYYQAVLLPGGDLISSSCATDILTQKPEMGELLQFVVPKIAADWQTLAYNLVEFSEVGIIEKRNPNDPEKCCQDLFVRWLTSNKDVKWLDLLNALKNFKKFTSATEEISKQLELLYGRLSW